MTLVCLASQKGSPGTTLTALAVAASFPLAQGRRKIILEADCAGGTLALRYQLPTEPGLLSLAAAIRSSQANELLWQHSQTLPGGLSIVPCPDWPDQVYDAMAASGQALGRWLEALPDVDVICDVGRLTPNSPTIDFVAEASAVLMVARSNVEQLQPAARRMVTLAPLVQHLGWVLIGDSPHSPSDVESTYGLPVVGVIADDSGAASKLESGVVSSELGRSPLVRSAGSLAEVLSNWLRPSEAPPIPEVADAPLPPSAPNEQDRGARADEVMPPPDQPTSWEEVETYSEQRNVETPPMSSIPSGSPIGSSSSSTSSEAPPMPPTTTTTSPTVNAGWESPPLPPSSNRIPEAPSGPALVPQILVESEPVIDSKPGEFIDSHRGPIAEVDGVDSWATLSSQNVQANESKQPIAEWIFDPVAAPPSKVSPPTQTERESDGSE